MIDYKDYEKLICKISWSFNHTTGIPFEVLKEEADWAFVEACIKHNPDRAAFSTFLYHYLTIQLCAFLKKKKEIPVEDMGLQLSKEIPMDKRVEITQAIEKGSDDFKTMFKLMMENCGYLVNSKKSVAKRWLWTRLRLLGWQRKQMQFTFQEAKEIVKSWT